MDTSQNQMKKTIKKLKKFQHTVYKETSVVCTFEPSPNLVICNAGLANGLSEETILEHFETCGELENILLLPGKSCSFICYKDVVSSQRAYENFNGNLNIAQDNKPIYLLFCNKLPENNDLFKVWNIYPPGLVIIEDFVSPEEEVMLIELCDFRKTENALDQMKHRQVKHFGFEFKYNINNVDTSEPLPDQIPDCCRNLFERLKETSFSNFKPDQLTVNCYKPGQGIPSHVDTHSAFEDPIMSLSLLSPVIMEFKKNMKTLCVQLPPRSLAVMSGESRYAWTHGITPRKIDTVATKDGLSTFTRGTRVSFTFRKVLHGPCLCNYKNLCDSHIERTKIENDIATRLEKIHVHDIYENIANHFSDTRNKSWPNVSQFVESFSSGSILVDIGCGNGKYLNLSNNIFKVGCDTSFGLLNVCREKAFQVFGGNCLSIPLKDSAADGAICIAVIHHLGNEERRINAIKEIIRILKIGGTALIYVWAKDQFKDRQKTSYIKQNRKQRKSEAIIEANEDQVETLSVTNEVALPIHINRTQFKYKDVLVPWKLKNTTDSSRNTFLRFYHVFEENELEDLCLSIDNVVIIKSYYDEGNWCVLIRKE